MNSATIGRHNPRVSEIRKALRQGTLTPDGLLPIEGPHLLEEARRSRLEIVETFAREEPAGDVPAEVPPGKRYTVPDAVFRSISATEEPQGIIGLVRPPVFDLDALLERRAEGAALLIVLCGLQDPGNAGTILRLGEAFGATGCVATAGTVGRYNPKLVRASAGSVFRFPHMWEADLEALRAKLAAAGIRLVGTAAEGETDIESVDWTGPTALMVGNEGAGLDSREREFCDALVRIPLSPWVESLNAATATAVVLYEARRRRRAAGR